uniref:GLPGLI family protein n=1 Tax=Flavobacterium sp. TaxID=239 RepID=UPI004049C683
MKSKKMFFLFVIIFLVHLNINAQNNVDITYSLNYSIEKNIKFESEEETLMGNDMLDIFLKFGDYVTFTLVVKNKQSIFFKNEIMFDDKLNDFQQKMISILESDTYFFDYQKNEFYSRVIFDGKNYIFSLNPDENKWEILNETKKIDNFNCIKAKFTTLLDNANEVTFFAWFTPELPFQTGPKDFIGLPGVILEVGNGSYSFVAKSINLNPSEAELSKVVMPNGTLITREELDKIVQKARDNFGY